VIEVIPPTVDTDLDKGTRERRGQRDRRIPPSEVAKATLGGLEKDEFENALSMAQNLLMGSRNNPELVFQSINRW